MTSAASSANTDLVSSSSVQVVVQVDPKLLHLVRKLCTAADSGSGTTARSSNENTAVRDDDASVLLLCVKNAESIVQILRSQHREYQRKDVAKLTTAVEAAIQHILSAGSSSSSSSKKRKQQEAKEEAEYDKAAAARDAACMGGGGLNALLRGRYKQVSLDRSQQQQQRQAQEETLSTATELSAAAATTSTTATSLASLTTTKMILNGGSTLNGTSRSAASISVVEDATERTTIGNPETGNHSSANEQTENGGGSKQNQAEELPPSRSNVKRKKVKRVVVRRSSTSGSGDDLGLGLQQQQQQQAFMLPVAVRPTERYADLGGMGDVIQMIRQLVEYPVTRPELYRHLGVDPPRGVLLRGPPGTYVFA